LKKIYENKYCLIVIWKRTIIHECVFLKSLSVNWRAFKQAAWSPLVQRAHEVRDLLLTFRVLSEQIAQSRSFRPSNFFTLVDSRYYRRLLSITY
jgi:hypothetical protein